MVRVSLHCTYGMFAYLHFGAKRFPFTRTLWSNMADNVNDKGDSRTILEIERAVVANLVLFRMVI